MLQDKSPDFEETWEFLDRRLEGVALLGKTLRQVCWIVIVKHGI